MNPRIFLLSLITLLCFSLFGQVTYNIEPYTTPALGGMDYEDANTFQRYFEKLNVGNLHVYSNGQGEPAETYFFKGTPIDRKWYRYFDRKWQTAHNKRFKAYATYAITIGEEMYFLIRLEGKKYYNSIELFSLDQGVITHHQTLASYVYELGIETQLDSWIQDFDLDTRKDILKKMSINYYWKDRPENYAAILKQYPDQSFEENDQLEVDPDDFMMHETK